MAGGILLNKKGIYNGYLLGIGLGTLCGALHFYFWRKNGRGKTGCKSGSHQFYHRLCFFSDGNLADLEDFQEKDAVEVLHEKGEDQAIEQ